MTTNQDIRLNVRTDTNEAVRQLRSLERQVDKLGNLADQGERNQRGFLSRKQVTLYRRILSEMEQAHSQHINRLTQAEEQLNRMKNSHQSRRVKDLEAEIRKREELLRASEGGNRWGEQANPIVQEYHRQKLDGAKDSLSEVLSSNDYRDLIDSTSELETEVSKLREVVSQMTSEMQRGDTHSDRIGDLRTRTPMTDMAEDGAGLLSRLAPIGVLGYGAYVGTGVGKLRQQEESAWQVSQKMGSFGDIEQHDEYLRSQSKDIGRANGYNAQETAITMGHLISGGTNGDLKARTNDVDAIQRLARGNAMDVNEIAIAGADLQKIGAVNEGNMARFAELIAGSIAKGNMGGREEELLRATTALASNVSTGLSDLSSGRLSDLMGIQSMLGDAIPSLKGDKGVEMLSSMDSAIKGGDNGFDLIMGKGVLPEFSGSKGVYNLGLMKEQGLSPNTLKYMFQGLDRMYGEGNHEFKAMTAKEKFGMSMESYNKLVESGLADRFKKGDFVGEDELRNLGVEDVLKDYENYKGTSTSEVQSMDSYSENRQADHSQPYDEAHKGIMGGFNAMPDWMQHTAVAGGALGTGLLMTRGVGALKRFASPKISGGGGGAGGATASLWSKMKGAGSSALDSAKGLGGKLVGNYGDDLLRGGAKLGSKIPIAGALIGTGADQLLNEDHDWGRSISKGVGGAIGGALGFLGGTALGLGSGGVGFLGLGAATVGGGAMGEKAGDWLYSLFAGDEDKKKDKKKESEKSEYDDAVSKFDDSSSSNTTPKAGKDAEKMLAGVGGEHTIKVVIEGKVDGMNKSNEDKIADGVKDYMQKLAKQGKGSNSVNLAFDQTRLT